MIEYMEYILRQYEKSTNWNRHNSYENITATSDNLLQFEIPDSINLQVSNKSTPYTFNTFELSNHKVINGSLSYLYTDCADMDNFVQTSMNVPLQTTVNTYQYIKPYYYYHNGSNNNIFNHRDFASKTLIYGRMYYPGSILEAMYCKRLSPFSQIVIKGLSSVNQRNILTLYWQQDKGSTCQEVIFSTSEALLGYRMLHNFAHHGSKLSTTLYNNSNLSLGSEFWLGIGNMLPGCSTTLRYFTHVTNTGKPITLTLSLNPLFGHISSSYSVKPSPGTTFCSKYEFNIYSIESKLSLGCEFWRSISMKKEDMGPSIESVDRKDLDYLNFGVENLPTLDKMKEFRNLKVDNPMYYHPLLANNSNDLINNVNSTFSSSLQKITREKSVIEKFVNLVNSTEFTSVLKMSTSLSDKNLRLLWEGRYKGFLISAGAELSTVPLDAPKTLNEEGSTTIGRPVWLRPAKFGIQLKYST
ncbi:Mdm10p Ecym_2623 [Eremothecium cymbalariae DBVPG|uniref:Mitochondrial distribution and morphology protein 10 n=1 Tax=Eremothecium cymbalariae (strain CBS 270.75 / DBVPG 7215 / KCTC 17166 / NRRL Y-17582) TaxID=931890 RepID=G8JQK3_ERECY|nr:Hypothetical protein Ecym_2623 [Eremothecium cymbalariae DBVPG\